MAGLCDIGAIIAPIAPAFYNRPKTIDDLINHCVGRLLSLMGVATDLVRPWDGGPPSEQRIDE
jgi:4-hydroxy-3-polyprenylbenzoate decarboxylase